MGKRILTISKKYIDVESMSNSIPQLEMGKRKMISMERNREEKEMDKDMHKEVA